jgi:hypothetical protein
MLRIASSRVRKGVDADPRAARGARHDRRRCGGIHAESGRRMRRREEGGVRSEK